MSGPSVAYSPEGLVITGPFTRGDKYVVAVEDPVAGETVEKVFNYRGQAADFVVAVMTTGDPTTRPLPRADWVEPVHEKQKAGGTDGYFTPPTLNKRHRPSVHADGTRMTSEERAETPRFAIRPVREVLESYGLDPTAEIAKALTALEPVLDDKGVQKVDDKGDPMWKPLINVRDRAYIANELMQYITPKLKAVEMKVEAPPMPIDQVDARIAQLANQHPELKALLVTLTNKEAAK